MLLAFGCRGSRKRELAQHERELFSERTKAALAAKKARGFVLGSPQNLTRDATVKAASARHQRALDGPGNKRATELASKGKS